MYSVYLSTSDLLIFIISCTENTNLAKWIWISCNNDLMNNVDDIITRDVYPPKIHICSKISAEYHGMF